MIDRTRTVGSGGPGKTDDRTSNAFDLVRLVGAALVVVSHSFPLTGHYDPLAFLSGGRIALGTVGVIFFFFTSGYLVAGSYEADRHVGRFALRRGLRIYPLYAVTVIVCALVVGPLATTHSLASYLTDDRTWNFVGNGLLLFSLQYDLPGVFTANPFPDVVNGQLWTIPMEVLCYGILLVLAVTRLARFRSAMIVISLALVAGCVMIDLTGYTGILVPYLVPANALSLFAAFALGTTARHVTVRPAPWFGPVTVTAAGAASLSPLPSLAVVPLCGLTWWIAFTVRGPLARPTGEHDLSFGLYVLSFPIQQWLVMVGVRSVWVVALATLAVVVPLATLSWRFVERPALALKPRRPVRAPRGNLDRSHRHDADTAHATGVVTPKGASAS